MKARTNNNKTKQTKFKNNSGPGQPCRCGNSLSNGRSEVCTPVGGKARAVQTGPGDHAASSTVANEALSLEQSSRGVAMTTHYNLAPSLSHTSSPPLCSCCLFRGDLYLYI